MYCKIAIAAALCFPLFVVPAQAERMIKIDIPFEFEAGQTKMPAGAYEVVFPGSNMVLIRSVDSKNATFLISNAVNAGKVPEFSKLVFNRYGDRHFLKEVWSIGYSQGRQLRPSKAEVEVARGVSGPTGREVAAALPARR